MPTLVCNNRISIMILFILITALVSGCSLQRVVPIQIARVPQMESFHQNFIFLGDSLEQLIKNSINSSEESLATLRKQDRRMDYVFKQLVGERNWQALKDLYGLRSLKNELIAGNIYIKGLLNFSIYIDPVYQEIFFIEGLGRFFLVREKTNAILLSGDFYIIPERHLVSELDKGNLAVNLKLFVTRIPEQITFLHEAPLRYNIAIDTSMRKQRIYAIDYKGNHEVHLVSKGNISDSSGDSIIGYLNINDTGYDSKLLDLRGLSYLKGDYEKIIRKARYPKNNWLK